MELVSMDFYRKCLSNYIKERNVSVVSNDCWGGQLYRHMGLEYNTPFVGLFLYAPCYIKLVSSFNSHIFSKNLFEIKTSKYQISNDFRRAKNWYYPIGLLDESIEIHFMHYKSWDEANEKWIARRKRINLNNLAFKFDMSKDLATVDLATTFENLPQEKKVILGAGNNKESSGARVFIPNWQMDGAKMYKISLEYFDILQWLKSGTVKKSLSNSIWFKFFVSRDKTLL